jgi:hypothetical protein
LRRTLANDLAVAAIVTIMLIPQWLAHALLAGLRRRSGLYASMAPLVTRAKRARPRKALLRHHRQLNVFEPSRHQRVLVLISEKGICVLPVPKFL